MYPVRFQVTCHVRAGDTEFAGSRGQVGGAAGRPQIQAQFGIVASGGAAVVRGELQRLPPGCGEDLQNLSHAQFARRRVIGLSSRRHRRCTAFA